MCIPKDNNGDVHPCPRLRHGIVPADVLQVIATAAAAAAMDYNTEVELLNRLKADRDEALGMVYVSGKYKKLAFRQIEDLHRKGFLPLPGDILQLLSRSTVDELDSFIRDNLGSNQEVNEAINLYRDERVAEQKATKLLRLRKTAVARQILFINSGRYPGQPLIVDNFQE